MNENYTYILFNHPELDLGDVYLLDRVQKGMSIEKKAIQRLRKYRLVEGRANQLYLSSEVAKDIEKEAEYIRNKGFDDQYYRDMIIKYIRQYGEAKKKDIKALLWDKLPDILTEKQKEAKISNLLTSLRIQNKIKRNSANQQTGSWILSEMQ